MFSFTFTFAFMFAPAFAEDLAAENKQLNNVHTDSQQILTKIKFYKNAIYSSLDLSVEQKEQINQLDEKLYKDIDKELVKVAVLSNRLIDIANSENCTKKAVNNVKKDFRPIQKNMYAVKKDYEKELYGILTKEQKSKYIAAKKQQREEYKKEMQEQKQLYIKNRKQTKS